MKVVAILCFMLILPAFLLGWVMLVGGMSTLWHGDRDDRLLCVTLSMLVVGVMIIAIARCIQIGAGE